VLCLCVLVYVRLCVLVYMRLCVPVYVCQWAPVHACVSLHSVFTSILVDKSVEVCGARI